MVLGCLALAAFYDLLRQENGLAPWVASAVVICLAVNPFYFLLGAMFHSDVPALAFSLLALALYPRGLRGWGLGAWWSGALLALLAVSTRQNALVVPAVAGLMLTRDQTGAVGRPGCWVPCCLCWPRLPLTVSSSCARTRRLGPNLAMLRPCR